MNCDYPGSGSESPHCMSCRFDIFICYRCAVSAMDAAHLYDRLSQAFGETVFIDHECLRAGQHWRKRIDEVITGSAVMVVVLSKGWYEEVQHRHRDHISDEVLREINLALDSERAHVFDRATGKRLDV